MSRLTLLLLVALIGVVACVANPTPLNELETHLSLLEQQADPSLPAKKQVLPPSNVEQILANARKYAKEKIAKAVADGKKLLESTVNDAVEHAEAVNSAIKATNAKAKQSKAALLKATLKDGKAGKKAAKVAKKAAKKAAKLAKKQKYIAAKLKSKKLKPNRHGLFGAVVLGAPKSASGPVSKPAGKKSKKKKNRRRSKKAKRGDHEYHLGERISKQHPRTCLKDIAAHYDEEDIYEQRKLNIQTEIEQSSNRKYIAKLKKQLVNLEKYHQLMQRKFMLTDAEKKKFLDPKNQGKYQLSPALILKIKANRAAKKAGLPVPFPNARKLAMAEVRKQKVAERRLQAQIRKSHGNGKKIVIPVIDEPWFPSRDHVSSTIRERMYRRVETDSDLSTDQKHIDEARKIVKDENKRHDDFIHSETARPFQKKIHEAITPEPSRPHYLINFPWAKKNDKVTIDSKIKVPQMDFKEW